MRNITSARYWALAILFFQHSCLMAAKKAITPILSQHLLNLLLKKKSRKLLVALYDLIFQMRR